MTVPPMLADYHLEQTRAFIAQNPTELQVARRTRVADGAGGWRYGPPFAAGPYVVRLVAYTGQDGGQTQRVDDRGALVTILMNLIAMPDTAILKGDQFRINNMLDDPSDDTIFEVLTVERTPPWRLQAKVYAHGV